MPPRAESHAPTFRIRPEAVVGADGDPIDTGQVSAGERAYRLFVDTPLAISASFRPEDAYDLPFHFAPIGSFDLTKLERPSNPINYVPYGAYDPPQSRLVAEPDGLRVGPVEMTPTLNQAGLIAVPPLAITDLSAAAMLRGQSPVDAVRVRVAGIDRFDEPARRRVERVATAIASLGLDVDIVAGSSPQSVEIYVPEYRVGPDKPSDLGYVAQGWTTMGAAERVTRGLGETNVALLALALLAAIVFAVAVQLTQLATRTREIAILRALGWPRGRIFRWIVGEAIVGSVIVSILGSAAWFLAGGTLAALMTAASVAALLPLSSLVFTHVAWRSAESASVDRGDLWTRVPRTGALRVRSPGTYALRSVLAHPARSSAAAAALAIGSAATSVACVAMAAAVSRAGPTLLATATANALRPYQLALLLMVGAGSVTLTVLLLKLDAADRRHEFQVLSAVGWEPNDTARMLWRHRAALALPASVLAAALAFLLAGAIGLSVPVVATIAAVLAGSVVVWGGYFMSGSTLKGTQ